MSELGLFGALETKINIEQERYLPWYLPYQKKKIIYTYTHTHIRTMMWQDKTRQMQGSGFVFWANNHLFSSLDLPHSCSSELVRQTIPDKQQHLMEIIAAQNSSERVWKKWHSANWKHKYDFVLILIRFVQVYNAKLKIQDPVFPPKADRYTYKEAYLR